MPRKSKKVVLPTLEPHVALTEAEMWAENCRIRRRGQAEEHRAAIEDHRLNYHGDPPDVAAANANYIVALMLDWLKPDPDPTDP